MSTKALVRSSFLILLSPFLYLVVKSSTTPWQEIVIFHLLLLNYLVSVLFWSTVDEPYGWIHRLDSFLIRLSSIIITLYTFIYKEYYKKIIFGIFLGLFLVCFHFSHYYSTHDGWASVNHIHSHRIFHWVGSIGICMVFL